jgi:hypothetical protein
MKTVLSKPAEETTADSFTSKDDNHFRVMQNGVFEADTSNGLVASTDSPVTSTNYAAKSMVLLLCREH